jgi:hypothetical protein
MTFVKHNFPSFLRITLLAWMSLVCPGIKHKQFINVDTFVYIWYFYLIYLKRQITHNVHFVTLLSLLGWVDWYCWIWLFGSCFQTVNYRLKTGFFICILSINKVVFTLALLFGSLEKKIKTYQSENYILYTLDNKDQIKLAKSNYFSIQGCRNLH